MYKYFSRLSLVPSDPPECIRVRHNSENLQSYSVLRPWGYAAEVKLKSVLIGTLFRLAAIISVQKTHNVQWGFNICIILARFCPVCKTYSPLCSELRLVVSQSFVQDKCLTRGEQNSHVPFEFGSRPLMFCQLWLEHEVLYCARKQASSVLLRDSVHAVHRPLLPTSRKQLPGNHLGWICPATVACNKTYSKRSLG